MQKLTRASFTMIITLILGIVFFTTAACAAGFSDDPDAIEAAAKSVLMLKIYDENGDLVSTGSGFVMFDNMTLVTNYHVIDEASLVIADSDDGEKYILEKVLIQDEANDIAILQFVKPTTMQPLPFSTDEVKRGSKVVAIGSPIGLKNTVSMGNVSAAYQEDGVNWIQFTAPISSGSSGGAVLNDAGQVIGISSATYTRGQNLNLAVSMEDVVALYKQWEGYNGLAEEQDGGLTMADWTDFEPIILSALYDNAASVMASDASRVVSVACAVLDYALAETSGPEIGGGMTYYLAESDDALVMCCPLLENAQGMQSAVLLYTFEEAMYSILPSELTLEAMVASLADGTYAFYTMSNTAVAEAAETLLDLILEEE